MGSRGANILETEMIAKCSRKESQASQDDFEWGLDHTSVSCVFLYFKFYCEGTISVPSKSGPL